MTLRIEQHKTNSFSLDQITDIDFKTDKNHEKVVLHFKDESTAKVYLDFVNNSDKELKLNQDQTRVTLQTSKNWEHVIRLFPLTLISFDEKSNTLPLPFQYLKYAHNRMNGSFGFNKGEKMRAAMKMFFNLIIHHRFFDLSPGEMKALTEKGIISNSALAQIWDTAMTQSYNKESITEFLSHQRSCKQLPLKKHKLGSKLLPLHFIAQLESKMSTEDKFQRKLAYSIERVNHRTEFGATNKYSDLVKTGLFNIQLKYYESGAGYFKYKQGKPLKKVHEWANASMQNDGTNRMVVKKQIGNWCLKNKKKAGATKSKDVYISNPEKLLEICTSINNFRAKNCYARSCLIAQYLWEHAEGIERIEIAEMRTFDHYFVIVNRTVELNKIHTCQSAWVVDAWYEQGIVFRASEFNLRIKKIKQFSAEQDEKFKITWGRESSLKFPPDGYPIKRIIFEIRPQEKPYPVEWVKQLEYSTTALSISDEFQKMRHAATLRLSLHRVKKFEDRMFTDIFKTIQKDNEADLDVKRNYQIKRKK